MAVHNNSSNRCPELQNILDSSFGFIVKWGTLLAILFILLILVLSFFVSIREPQMNNGASTLGEIVLSSIRDLI